MAWINNKIWTITDKFRSKTFWENSYVIKTIIWNWYVDLTNAIANELIYVKLIGSCFQNGNPTPDNQIWVTCNNWEIKFSQNLLDMSDENIRVWRYVNNSWVPTESSTNFYNTQFIKVKPNTTYTVSFSQTLCYFSFMEYDINQEFVRRTLKWNWSTPTLNDATITTRSNTEYLIIWSNMFYQDLTLELVKSVNFMLVEWSTVPEYAEYWKLYTNWLIETIEDELNNSATAEMLLSIWDDYDEQEILSWNITRRIWIKILDGTEWRILASGTWYRQFYTSQTQWIIKNSVSLYSNITEYWCTASTRTNYQYWCYSWWNGNLCFQMVWSSTLTTVETWTQYLADQFNNKTPVIVIYPLVTEASETVPWQILNIKNWTNRIEITQASINDLSLQVQYKATS